MPGRVVVLALLSLGTLLLAPSARAEEPVLTVRGLGTWDEALANLRADTVLRPCCSLSEGCYVRSNAWV
jgi:hypothetical protein